MKLYDSGRTYLLRARQFAHVVVEFSDDGQKADARLWDSPGDDIFEGTLGNCRFYSNETDFDVTILGANFVTVRTTNGGNDRAILHDSPEADVFRAKPHKVEMGDRATGGEFARDDRARFQGHHRLRRQHHAQRRRFPRRPRHRQDLRLCP